MKIIDQKALVAALIMACGNGVCASGGMGGLSWGEDGEGGAAHGVVRSRGASDDDRGKRVRITDATNDVRAGIRVELISDNYDPLSFLSGPDFSDLDFSSLPAPAGAGGSGSGAAFAAGGGSSAHVEPAVEEDVSATLRTMVANMNATDLHVNLRVAAAIWVYRFSTEATKETEALRIMADNMHDDNVSLGKRVCAAIEVSRFAKNKEEKTAALRIIALARDIIASARGRIMSPHDSRPPASAGPGGAPGTASGTVGR